jgi:predicted DNA-binding protein (UPF0278 family)
MIIDIPPKIEIYFEQHEDEKLSFCNNIQTLINQFEERIDNTAVFEENSKDNKHIQWAKKYASIGKDEFPNEDFGKIIRDGRDKFRDGFQF